MYEDLGLALANVTVAWWDMSEGWNTTLAAPISWPGVAEPFMPPDTSWDSIRGGSGGDAVGGRGGTSSPAVTMSLLNASSFPTVPYLTTKDPRVTPWPLLKQPTFMVVILTLAYLLVFIFGVVNNSLVVAVIYRNPQLRTVTNYFLANLAIADILVSILVLPITLLTNLFTGQYHYARPRGDYFFFSLLNISCIVELNMLKHNVTQRAIASSSLKHVT